MQVVPTGEFFKISEGGNLDIEDENSQTTLRHARQSTRFKRKATGEQASRTPKSSEQ